MIQNLGQKTNGAAKSGRRKKKMGRESAMKDLRKQLRNIVKEQLPEVFSTELAQNIEQRLVNTMAQRLNAVDERQKDMNNMLLRHMIDAEVKKGVQEPTKEAELTQAT